MASKPMNPKRKQRLILILFLMGGLGVVVGLAMFALTENINLFYNPSQIAAGEAPQNARIRVGGMVVDGSVKRDPDSLEVSFDLTDYESVVTVTFNGILPDLFREGQGIVALGKMTEGNVVKADEVLAKHDENYMPPEVAEALEKAHAAQQAKKGAYGEGDAEYSAGKKDYSSESGYKVPDPVKADYSDTAVEATAEGKY